MIGLGSDENKKYKLSFRRAMSFVILAIARADATIDDGHDERESVPSPSAGLSKKEKRNSGCRMTSLTRNFLKVELPEA